MRFLAQTCGLRTERVSSLSDDLSRWLVINHPSASTCSRTPTRGRFSAVSSDKENSPVSTCCRVCSPASQTGSSLPLIRASQSVGRQILLLKRGVKGEGRRALPVKRHTCFILLSRKQRSNRRPHLCRSAVSTSESNLLPLTFFFSLSFSVNIKGQMTPFLQRPVRPATGGSESHFLSPPLKVPLQTLQTGNSPLSCPSKCMQRM